MVYLNNYFTYSIYLVQRRYRPSSGEDFLSKIIGRYPFPPKQFGKNVIKLGGFYLVETCYNQTYKYKKKYLKIYMLGNYMSD